MKRLLLIALGACLALSCARREAPAAPRETLYRHLTGDPATLDPTVTNETQGLLVEEMIFRSLVGIDAERRFVPALAASWTVSPDGLIYEFHLDPAARWEGGAPVTSDDVAFTVERIRDPKVPAVTWRSGFEGLVAVETPDATTVRIRFDQPYAERLFAFNLPIVSRAAFGAAGSQNPNRRPVGSGPYRLESWEPNQKLTLARREDAAGSEAHFQRIVFRVIPDRAVWFQAGSRGDLDEFRVNRDQRASAAASADFTSRHRILKVPQFVQALVLWNCRHPFLADSRVRLALAGAWPREQTGKQLYPPDGAALVSGPYLPGVPESAADVELPPYDPAASERLLEEAGYRKGRDGVRRNGDRRASLELLYPTGLPIYPALTEILRQAFGKVGVELVLRPLEWAAYIERVGRGDFEAQLAGRYYQPPNLDPYPYYHSSQFAPQGQNQGFYRNAEADRAMEAMRREMGPERRLELYRQVHRLLAADPPADFLWGADQYWAVAKRVEGVTIAPIGLFFFLPGPHGWRPVPASPR